MLDISDQLVHFLFYFIEFCSELIFSFASACKSVELFNLIVEKLLDIGGPIIKDILDKTFYESQATRIITTVKYPSEMSTMAFTHPSCLITSEEVSEKLYETYFNQTTTFSCCQSRDAIEEDMQ